MATVDEIKWGAYKDMEGPFYWGKHRFELPANSDIQDEMVYITSLTEGCADAINGYDSCIWTGGGLQWCDRAPFFLYAKLLGYIAEHHSNQQHIHDCLEPALKASNARFQEDGRGGWRFFLVRDKPIEVTTQALQRELYFAGASGKKGEWSKAQRQHAKLWAACCATIFEDQEAIALQLRYTKDRVPQFALPEAKRILFDDSDPLLKGAMANWVRAARVTYISFAANNPTWALRALKEADESKHVKYSPPWVVNLIRLLVSQHKIYPHRYKTIRPKLEEIYGIDLPNTAEELERGDIFIEFSEGLYTNLKDIQAALIYLGYEPGPVDGLMGSQTRAAIKLFQADAGLEVSGKLKPATIQYMADQETKTRAEEKLMEAEMIVPAPVPPALSVKPSLEDTVVASEPVVESLPVETDEAAAQGDGTPGLFRFFRILFDFVGRLFNRG